MSPGNRQIQVGSFRRFGAVAHLGVFVFSVACALALCLVGAPAAVGQSDDWSPDHLLVPSAEDLTDTVLDLLGRLRASPPEHRAALERRLEEVVAVRHQMLGATIKDEPEKVIRCALSAIDRESFPALVRRDLEGPIEIDGTVSVVSEERGPGNRLEYALDGEAGLSGTLRFAGDPPQLLPGTRVRVAGVLLDKDIAVTAISSLETPPVSDADGADDVLRLAVPRPFSPPSPPPTPTADGQ